MSRWLDVENRPEWYLLYRAQRSVYPVECGDLGRRRDNPNSISRPYHGGDSRFRFHPNQCPHPREGWQDAMLRIVVPVVW